MSVYTTFNVQLKAIGVPQHYRGLFLQDVMGSFQTPGMKGLVDAESDEEFDKMLLNLCLIWKKRSRVLFKSSTIV